LRSADGAVVARVSAAPRSRQDFRPGRQGCVRTLREHGGRIHTFVGFAGRSGSQEFEELFVADVLYVLLLVGGFVVLALCLRGLERL
jgi:hypothetical protein